MMMNTRLQSNNSALNLILDTINNLPTGEGNTEMQDALITGELTKYTNKKITKIGMGALTGNSNLISVNLPNCLTAGPWAFYNCTKLKTVNLPKCVNISQAFRACTSIESVSLPECELVGQGAFYNCFKLQSLDFPKCTYIDYGAFSSCSSLSFVSFPVCSSVSKYAFCFCSSLAFVNLPKCTTIQTYAFNGCTKLEKIYLGQNTSAEDLNPDVGFFVSAFSSCWRLSNLTLYYPEVITLKAGTALVETPMYKSTNLGYFGSIYVPASLVDSYKSATNWTVYTDRITAIEELGGGE